MMRYAVVLTDRRLVPAWDGNRLRILGLIRALRAVGCRVALVGANLGPVEALTPLVDRLVILRAPSFQGGDLASFDVGPFRRALQRVADELRPIVVIAEHAWLAPALLTLPHDVQRWVDCHDVLHERVELFRAAGLDPWTTCTQEQEIDLLSGADVLITRQHRNANTLASLFPRKRVACVMTPIPLPRGFRQVPADGGIVLAVGTPHTGNEAICKFAREAWPRIVARVPQARLEIVGEIGRNLPALPGIEAVVQAADLDQHYASAAIVVCPDTFGSGAEFRMLEAIRLGKAAVVTEAASAGLPVPERRAWITTPSLAAGADAVAALLGDPAARAELEDQAFAFGERHLSLKVFRDRLDALLPNRFSRRFAMLLNRQPPVRLIRRKKRRSKTGTLEDTAAPAYVPTLSLGSVTVIVPCAGWPDTLPACVESLQAQLVGVPVEIIIVINGREPAAADRAWPGVRIVHEPRLGPAAARNAGVRAATGDVLAFIDADCVAAPQWLASALATMHSGAAEGIVAGAITRSGAARSWTSFYDSVTYLQQERYVKGRTCVTANVIVHRTVFARVGPFDEMFDEAAFEDWEWALRAQRAGAAIVYDAGAVVDHPCMAELSHLKRKAERLARGELLFRRKLHGGASAPPLLVTLYAQIRRAFREDRMSGADRLRLMCVGLAAGFWTWRAARSWQQRSAV